jgi:chromosome segregation ATPase
VRGDEDVEVLQRRVSLLESELVNNRQSLSAMEMDDAQRYRALQDEHERELVALRARIERLESKNQSLEKLLADEKSKSKKKRRDSDKSDSSSDEEGGAKISVCSA